jgi:hypothetical protein
MGSGCLMLPLCGFLYYGFICNMAENSGLEKDLEMLDQALTILKRDFEIYFSGGLKLPPLEAQRKIEREIRKISRLTNLNYAQRFRYNNLSARFNTYVDLWNKQMRYKEEGRTPSGAVIQIAQKETKPPKSKSLDSQSREYQKLFNDYQQCRQKTGESAAVTFDKFAELISKQKEAILVKYDCKEVEFNVVIEQGKTKLKAKPVK